METISVLQNVYDALERIMKEKGLTDENQALEFLIGVERRLNEAIPEKLDVWGTLSLRLKRDIVARSNFQGRKVMDLVIELIIEGMKEEFDSTGPDYCEELSSIGLGGYHNPDRAEI